MGRARSALWPLGAIAGIAAERNAFGTATTSVWLPDLITGWWLIGCGLIARRRRPESKIGDLITASGFLWFAGNFTGWSGAIGTLSAQALYLHRGPLFQAVLTFAIGRPRNRWERAAVIAGWCAAAIPGIWQSEVGTIAAATALAVVAMTAYRSGASAIDRPTRAMALQTGLYLAALLVATTLPRAVETNPSVSRVTLIAYDIGLCALSFWLAWWLANAAVRTLPITDRVVDLSEVTPGTLQDALSVALGDPTLEVGYPVADGYVDQTGKPLRLPPLDARIVTEINLGQDAAVLVHDPAVLTDVVVIEAIETAARLSVANAQLQAELQVQLANLRDSRRRLLRAGDNERRRLERRLMDGAMQRLIHLEQRLDGLGGDVADDTRSPHIARAREQIAGTRRDLLELARGLHPAVLTESGLVGALGALADQAPLPVELRTSFPPQPREVEAVCYYVASEALANIVKHAQAGRAAIAVELVDGALGIRVVDDGTGGASLDRGSGLRGLADRLDSLGGSLDLESPPGAGTVLTARIPVAER
jgi:signal transduction histidine kinase